MFAYPTTTTMAIRMKTKATIISSVEEFPMTLLLSLATPDMSIELVLSATGSSLKVLVVAGLIEEVGAFLLITSMAWFSAVVNGESLQLTN